MINKELELTINQQDILGKLANNLGITTVTDNCDLMEINSDTQKWKKVDINGN